MKKGLGGYYNCRERDNGHRIAASLVVVPIIYYAN